MLKLKASFYPLILALLGFLANSSLSSSLNAAEAASAPRVLYVGDSIAVETSDIVAWWSKNYSNATTSFAMFSGLAICDFTEGKPSPDATESTLRTRVKQDKPNVVVLQFVGNRWTSCMQNLADNEAYYNKYKNDAQEATRQITEAAAQAGIPRPKIIWVLQGPWENSSHTTRMNRQYKELAAQNGDLTSDAGAEVSMAAFNQGDFATQREIYTKFVPCSSFEKDAGYCTDLANNLTRVHKDTDNVHYCLGKVTGTSCDEKSPGILRYGMRIAQDIKKTLDQIPFYGNYDHKATLEAAHKESARVLYIGDSIAFETAPLVETWTNSYFKAEFKRLMWGGLALCDFTSIRSGESDSQLQRALVEQKPHLVIMQLTGNALTPCITGTSGNSEAYWAQYEQDAINASEQVTSMAQSLDIPRPIILWVMQAPSLMDPSHNQRINEIYRRIAVRYGDLTTDAGYEVSKAVLPNGDYLKDRYSYTQFVPCNDYEINNGYCTDMANKLAQVHKDTDPTHFCLSQLEGFDCTLKSPGELRYSQRIAKDAKAALGF